VLKLQVLLRQPLRFGIAKLATLANLTPNPFRRGNGKFSLLSHSGIVPWGFDLDKAE
jgi:hypothetical protein